MKKHLIFLTSILATTVLSSIGFATWIITGNSEVNAGGNAVVDGIEDKSLGITYGWDTDNSSTTSFIFGWKESTTIYKWLVNSDTSTKESLTHTLNISIANTEYLKELNFAVSASGDKWDNEAWDKYIVKPTLNKIEKEDMTIKSDKSGTCSLEVTFGWGSLFGGENPYTYYNNQSFSTTLKEDAVSKIGQLAEYLKDVTFTFTISATLVS